VADEARGAGAKRQSQPDSPARRTAPQRRAAAALTSSQPK